MLANRGRRCEHQRPWHQCHICNPRGVQYNRDNESSVYPAEYQPARVPAIDRQVTSGPLQPVVKKNTSSRPVQEPPKEKKVEKK